MAPVISIKQMGGALLSPQIKEICKKQISTSLENIFSSHRFTTDSSFIEIILLKNIIFKIVRIIYRFSKYQYGIPRKIHSKILQILWENYKKTINILNLNNWSDDSIWIRILKIGESENQKVTIFNILEYIKIWKWYDK
jgi:hypothetical protein